MDKLTQKISDYYKKYYKDSLGILTWQKLVQGRLSEEEIEKERIVSLQKILGPFKDKKKLGLLGTVKKIYPLSVKRCDIPFIVFLSSLICSRH